MPEFVYVGEDGMFYPDLSLTPTRGDTVELVRSPTDGRWVPAGSPESAEPPASDHQPPAPPAAPPAPVAPVVPGPAAPPAPVSAPVAAPAAPDTEIK